MVIRVLMLLFALIIFFNLLILAFSLLIKKNIYKIYGKQIIISFALFILVVIAIYTALAFIGLN